MPKYGKSLYISDAIMKSEKLLHTSCCTQHWDTIQSEN